MEPARSQRVIRKESQSSGQHVGLPAVFFRFGVALIACRDGAFQLVVTLCLQQLVDIAALLLTQPFPLEEGGIGHRHGP